MSSLLSQHSLFDIPSLSSIGEVLGNPRLFLRTSMLVCSWDVWENLMGCNQVVFSSDLVTFPAATMNEDELALLFCANRQFLTELLHEEMVKIAKAVHKEFEPWKVCPNIGHELQPSPLHLRALWELAQLELITLDETIEYAESGFIYCFPTDELMDWLSQQLINDGQPSMGGSRDEPEEHQPMTSTTRDQVFISYSHQDKRWLDDLLTHLKPYVREKSIKHWSDRQIMAGSKWLEEIRAALSQTRVAVLLVTPDFLASDFIHQEELGPLLKEAEKGGLRILWIPVRASSYETSALQHYQALCDPDKPLAAMRAQKRDAAWVEICKHIKEAYDDARPAPAPFQWLIEALAALGIKLSIVGRLNEKGSVPSEIAFTIPPGFCEGVVNALRTADRSYAEADLLSAAEIRDRSKLKEFMADAAIDALWAILACMRNTSAGEAELALTKGVLQAILGKKGFALAETSTGFDEYLNALFVAGRDHDEDQWSQLRKEFLDWTN